MLPGCREEPPWMSCPYDIALSRLESGGFHVNQPALPNEHLPAAQSPEGGQVLN